MSKYFKKNKECFEYPEQMELILTYLYEHGEIICTTSEIEYLYERFSKEKYNTPWLAATPKGMMLTEFANWLDELEDWDD